MFETAKPGETVRADVAIIGAGVSGASIARTLSAYRLDVVLLEKECDVSFGTSKANSGIVHAGFHHNGKYLKTRLELEGNLMFDNLQRELDFPFRRCGIIVAAMNEEEMKYVYHLYEQGLENGAIGLEMCSRERLLALEPKLNQDVAGGLLAPGGGIVEPYRFVFSLVESAQKNGVRVLTEFKAARHEYADGRHTIVSESGGRVEASWVVNAAGLFADEVSRICGAEEFQIRPRKGEYYLLDRMTAARPNRVVFPVPTRVSKGMLVIPTVEGTVLIGPTADKSDDKEDCTTSAEKLGTIFDAARKMIPTVSEGDVITSFAGLRPAMESGDFYIEISKKVPGLVQVAGIQSPGLTASPAIGVYVKNLLKKAGCTLTEKPEFDPFLSRVQRIRDLSETEADELIRKDPRYGNIVCRCERVSEAEIVAAIRRGHTSLDGIKFYCRTGMGRCQGGFCTYRIIKILMRETGMSYDEITRRGRNSPVLAGEL